jgi:hypothetical protein
LQEILKKIAKIVDWMCETAPSEVWGVFLGIVFTIIIVIFTWIVKIIK